MSRTKHTNTLRAAMATFVSESLIKLTVREGTRDLYVDKYLPIAPDGRHRWWFPVVGIEVYALCRVRVPSSRAANLPKKLRQLGGMYVAEQRECGCEETELNEKAYHPVRPEPMPSKGRHWQRRASSKIRPKESHVYPGDDFSTIQPAKEVSGESSLAWATKSRQCG